MKKIENIIDNCIDCRFAERYNHPDVCRCAAFICTRMNPQRLAGFDGDSGIIQVPDWCPLETYKDAEKSEAQPDAAAAAPSTIILPGMPNLEWMAENLRGLGGTEINGETYYTYDETEEAVKKLVKGWRLPTREEFEALSDLGSTWDKETKGRWFGGNHDTDHKDSLFFPALGYRVSTTEALANVGTNGYYWSSSLYAADNAYAGYLSFDATNVLPLVITSRASGYPVRCVRDAK